jgi:hypothetical protein
MPRKVNKGVPFLMFDNDRICGPVDDGQAFWIYDAFEQQIPLFTVDRQQDQLHTELSKGDDQRV